MSDTNQQTQILKLQAGKRYWRRDGGVSPVVCPNDDGDLAYPFRAGSNTFRSDGRFNRWQEHENDLVREYTEPQPQPLEWKRGIPTEDECRECWLIVGGDGERPFRIDAHCHGPDATKQRHWKQTDWYLALNVKPVEPPKPKTKTVTQRKYTTRQGEVLWTHLLVPSDAWNATEETREELVPCE